MAEVGEDGLGPGGSDRDDVEVERRDASGLDCAEAPEQPQLLCARDAGPEADGERGPRGGARELHERGRRRPARELRNACPPARARREPENRRRGEEQGNRRHGDAQRSPLSLLLDLPHIDCRHARLCRGALLVLVGPHSRSLEHPFVRARVRAREERPATGPRWNLLPRRRPVAWSKPQLEP